MASYPLSINSQRSVSDYEMTDRSQDDALSGSVSLGRDSLELDQMLRLPVASMNNSGLLSPKAVVAKATCTDAANNRAQQIKRKLLSKKDGMFPKEDWTRRLCRPVRQIALYSWLWESLSFLVALGFLIAFLIVLRQHNGHPLPRWPYRMTIGSLVALLNTFMKAAMAIPLTEGISQLEWSWIKKGALLKDMATFDEASRGP